MAKVLKQLVDNKVTCLSSDVIADVIDTVRGAYYEALAVCGTAQVQYFTLAKQYASNPPPPEGIEGRWAESQLKTMLKRLEVLHQKRHQLASLWRQKHKLTLKIHLDAESAEDHSEALKDVNSILEEMYTCLQAVIKYASKTCVLLTTSFTCPE